MITRNSMKSTDLSSANPASGGKPANNGLKFHGFHRFEPTSGDVGRPYYPAVTRLQALALLELDGKKVNGDKSSYSLRLADALGLEDPIPDARIIKVGCTDPLEDIGNSLRLFKTQAGSLAFRWQDISPEPDDYVLLEDGNPDGSFSIVAGSGPDGATGLAVPTPADLRIFYHVAGRNLPDCIGPF